MIDTPLGKRSFTMQTKALISKELRQILRDKELLMMLVVMPVMQITLYSLALSPEVEHLQLGVIDYSASPTSREFVARLVKNQVFDILDSGGTSAALSKKVKDGQLDAGIVIPPDFERRIKSERRVAVQVLLDGVDANTAGIASGYIAQILQAFNAQLSTGTQNPRELIEPMVSYAYNPGLESKWFFVPGVLAMVLNLVSTLVSSAAVIREKDTGTLEQLLMTPVNSMQILIAKIVPLAIVLMINVFISLFIAVFIYHIPFRGNLLLFLGVSLLAIIVGISLGISLAAFAANQRQSLLTSFFVNLPVIQLSGALTPIESMPDFWQKVALLDPLRYYVACVKAIMLKGVGIEAIWKDVLALLVFAVILLFASSMRFRKQLQ